MKRLLLVLALCGVALTASGSALATDECNGLDVCISVPGPWVVVPGSPRGRLSTVEYQMTCPAGTIVGGLDALLGHRGLDVRFLGKLGSPVNPGISTERAVVLVATQARRAPTVFRPLLGCIPTSGGGGRTTTRAGAVPARPPVRLVRSLRVRTGQTARLVVACRSSERLVGSSHAVTFRGNAKPVQTSLAAVRVIRREQGNTVRVTASRSAAVPARARVDVQVHALCARGPA